MRKGEENAKGRLRMKMRKRKEEKRQRKTRDEKEEEKERSGEGYREKLQRVTKEKGTIRMKVRKWGEGNQMKS